MGECVREDIHIDLFAIRDLIAAAATAALRMRRIVQSLLRIKDTQTAADADALQGLWRAVETVQLLDIKDRMKHRMIERQGLERVFREDPGHFGAQRTVPFGRGAPCGSKQEAAALDITPEHDSLRIQQLKSTLAG